MQTAVNPTGQNIQSPLYLISFGQLSLLYCSCLFWPCFYFSLITVTASAGQYSSFVVRDGDEVTLPCENAKIKQQDCKNTAWLFREAVSSPLVELVGFGQMSEAKSDGLSVTAHCSLVLKKVSIEDVGRYSCRQFEGQDAHVYLSVINSEYISSTCPIRIKYLNITVNMIRVIKVRINLSSVSQYVHQDLYI